MMALNVMSISDIDECEWGRTECTQGCRNLRGAYMCTCEPGYQLGTDGKSCYSSSLHILYCIGVLTDSLMPALNCNVETISYRLICTTQNFHINHLATSSSSSSSSTSVFCLICTLQTCLIHETVIHATFG